MLLACTRRTLCCQPWRFWRPQPPRTAQDRIHQRRRVLKRETRAVERRLLWRRQKTQRGVNLARVQGLLELRKLPTSWLVTSALFVFSCLLKLKPLSQAKSHAL